MTIRDYFTAGGHERVVGCSRHCGINAGAGPDRDPGCIRNPRNREASWGGPDGRRVCGEGERVPSSRRADISSSILPDILVLPGFGTRHASAPGINSKTGAIALVVSGKRADPDFLEGKI